MGHNTNPGSSVAYDLVFTDNLSSFMTLIPGSVNSSDGVILTGNGGGDSFISINGTAPFLEGTVITITYSARLNLNVAPSGTYPNTANLQYLTAPPMDYNVNNVKTLLTPGVNSIVIADPVATMELNSTNLNKTSLTISVGETIRMLVKITIPQGTSQNSVLSISLPYSQTILRAVSSKIIAFPSNINSSKFLGVGSEAVITDNYLGDGVADYYVYDFGTLVNLPTDKVSSGPNDTIIIEVYAIMILNAGNIRGRTPTPTCTFAYFNGTKATSVPGSLRTTIVEPTLYLTKTDVAPSYTEATSIVKYTVTVIHQTYSTGTAYSLSVTDTLPVTTSLVPGSVSTSYGVVTTGNGNNDTFVKVDIDQFTVSQANIVITYSAMVRVTAVLYSTITNTASVQYYSYPTTMPGVDGRPYPVATATSDFTMAYPSASASTIVESSVPLTSDPSTTIGEVVVVRANFIVPQGTMNNAVLVLFLFLFYFSVCL